MKSRRNWVWWLLAALLTMGVFRALFFRGGTQQDVGKPTIEEGVGEIDSWGDRAIDRSRTFEDRAKEGRFLPDGGIGDDARSPKGGAETAKSRIQEEIVTGDRVDPTVEVNPPEKEIPPTAEEIRRLLASSKVEERRKGEQALGEMEDEAEKMAILKEMLEGDDVRAKRVALLTLSGMKGPEAIGMVLDQLKEQYPEQARRRLAGMLPNMVDERSAGVLQDAFRWDDPIVKQGTAVALEKLGYRQPILELIETTAAALTNPDGGKREDAVVDLWRLRSPETIPYLAQALADTNSHIRLEAVRGLAATADASALPYLEKALNDADKNVRQAAERGIEWVKNPSPARTGVQRSLPGPFGPGRPR